MFQIRVVASDGGNPALTDVTLVYVNVTRNLFAPSFNPTQYSVAIPESQSLGTPIRTVTATDQDATVNIASRKHVNECIFRAKNHILPLF